MIPQAANAIETLKNLAQQGEIDPWDVQVIEVVDRFLNEIENTQQSDKVFQQTTLPKSGQAFLWASMLVRFKADTLDRLHSQSFTQEEDFNEVDNIEEDIVKKQLLRPDLEKYLRRRNAALPTRKRKVNLQELISYIEEFAEELEVSKPSKKPQKTPRAYSQREATKMVVELAHQENLTELLNNWKFFFKKNFHNVFRIKKKLVLKIF